MKRLLMLACCSLALGALLTFAASCRVAAEAQQKGFVNLSFSAQNIDALPSERRMARTAWVERGVSSRIPDDYLHVVRAWDVVEVQMLAAPVPLADDPACRTWMLVEVLESGWPYRSFSGERVYAASIPLQACADLWSAHDRTIIPTRPLWRGFWANTLLFALGVFLAIEFVRLILAWPRFVERARLRRQPGCPDCGYDLHGAAGDGCPECGWKRTSESRSDRAGESA